MNDDEGGIDDDKGGIDDDKGGTDDDKGGINEDDGDGTDDGDMQYLCIDTDTQIFCDFIPIKSSRNHVYVMSSCRGLSILTRMHQSKSTKHTQLYYHWWTLSMVQFDLFTIPPMLSIWDFNYRAVLSLLGSMQ